MVESSCEAVWSWAFVCWKISDYSFDFQVMGLLRFSISSWFSFGKLYFSKDLSISFKLSILLAYSCWQWSLMILCISLLSVVISLFSFLILLIWFFSLWFLMSLANGLSILFIFSKNQVLALLIFAIVCVCVCCVCVYFCHNFLRFLSFY